MASECHDLHLYTREPRRLECLRRWRASRRESAASLDAPRAVARNDVVRELVGSSPALQSVLGRARKVAPTDSTVLVTGETGTGKELLARAIHQWSRRAARPFVSVNCAAIPVHLDRVGALRSRARRLHRRAAAAPGPLRSSRPAGPCSSTRSASCRPRRRSRCCASFRSASSSASEAAPRCAPTCASIAATNRDLADAVAEGAFRSDLYYRLQVFPLEMPPLRERAGDVRQLVEHFVQRYARKVGRTIRGIDPGTLEQLEAYAWPGNVRELQNVVERSLILGESELFSLDESWLPASAPRSEPAPRRRRRARPCARRSTRSSARRSWTRCSRATGWSAGRRAPPRCSASSAPRSRRACRSSASRRRSAPAPSRKEADTSRPTRSKRRRRARRGEAERRWAPARTGEAERRSAARARAISEREGPAKG